MAEDPFGNFWGVFGENPHQILTTLVQDSLDSINKGKDELLEQAGQILESKTLTTYVKDSLDSINKGKDELL